MSHYSGHQIRVKCDSPVARRAEITIGEEIIPFNKATIVLDADDFVRITLEVPAEAIDIEALAEHTTVELAPRKIANPSQKQA